MKLVSLAVAASVLALSSAAFAANTPAPAAEQGKVVQAQAKDCSKITDEKEKAKCEEENKAQNAKNPAAKNSSAN